MTGLTKLIDKIEQTDSVWLVSHGEDCPVCEADHDRLSDYERAVILNALRGALLVQASTAQT